MAAQLYFSAQIAERQHCPWPNCGAAFFVEEEEDDREKEERVSGLKNLILFFLINFLQKMLLCPECSRLFCRRCCATDGTCKCVDKVVGQQFFSKKIPNFAVFGTRWERIADPAHHEELSELRGTHRTRRRLCPHSLHPMPGVGRGKFGRFWHNFWIFVLFQTQWCFICLKVWSDNCQWDHWFEWEFIRCFQFFNIFAIYIDRGLLRPKSRFN